MSTLISSLTANPTSVSDLTGGTESSLFELFEAVKAGKASVALNNDGVLTASLSKRSVRAIRRAEKAARQEEIKAEIVNQLEAQRPQKIGSIVEAITDKFSINDSDKQKFRTEVLEAFRALRSGDNPVVKAENATNSNFHVSYTLAAKPEAFPVVEEQNEETVDEVAALAA